MSCQRRLVRGAEPDHHMKDLACTTSAIDPAGQRAIWTIHQQAQLLTEGKLGLVSVAATADRFEHRRGPGLDLVDGRLVEPIPDGVRLAVPLHDHPIAFVTEVNDLERRTPPRHGGWVSARKTARNGWLGSLSAR